MLSGLYTALSGMHAHRTLLDVTSHNVANQATEGFHRQRAVLQPGGLGTTGGVFAGQEWRPGGVDAVGVERVVDQLAETRLVRASAHEAGAATLAGQLERIEMAFQEPSDTGIAALLDDFWGGWTDLTTLPADPAVRSQLLERADAVVDALHRADADLHAVAAAASEQVAAIAADVNQLAAQLAQLNKAIASSPTTPNDLLDQRDGLVRQLSALTGAISRPAHGGQIEVTIGGRSLVSGEFAHRVDGLGGNLSWVDGGAPVAATEGAIAAVRQVLTEVVPKYTAALDGVAAALVANVNAVHAAGYGLDGNTGRNFFDPGAATAATIRLSDDVALTPSNIAAGAPQPGPTAPGTLDGEQARAIAGLAGAPGGPDAAYRELVTELGIEVRSALRTADIQGQVLANAESVAAAAGSVSIDEEMVNLLAAQRGYEASARVLTAIDELLETLLHRTGRVGL